MEKYNRYIIMAARLVSVIFIPWFLPLLGFVLVLTFSELNRVPWQLKLLMIALVYFFTMQLPYWLVHTYRRVNGWTKHEMSQRERRIVPYMLSIVCYTALLYLMGVFHMPHYTISIIAGALILQMICSVVNLWKKVSTHAAAIGGIIGALMGFALIYAFNPIGWLCVSILVAGVVCTARMILRQHTLGELGLGLLIGLLSGWCAVIFL